MVKVELTDDELITIISFLARSIRDSGSLSETQLWKKLREARKEYQMSPEFRNSVADAVGEGETTNSCVDEFGLPTWNEI